MGSNAAESQCRLIWQANVVSPGTLWCDGHEGLDRGGGRGLEGRGIKCRVKSWPLTFSSSYSRLFLRLAAATLQFNLTLIDWEAWQHKQMYKSVLVRGSSFMSFHTHIHMLTQHSAAVILTGNCSSRSCFRCPQVSFQPHSPFTSALFYQTYLTGRLLVSHTLQTVWSTTSRLCMKGPSDPF